jgi:POT family proton-dependent oligopeptide transporter
MLTWDAASGDARPPMSHAVTEHEKELAQKKGHPKGLYYLFFTEMWERFSYYGMRALLVLYLINYLEWQPGRASGVYKWYTSLVYLTPLLGGLLADRVLGLRAAIIIGGVLMGIGHFLMAFEPLPIFYAALAFLIVGNGFFKPNISTLVGKMYTPDDPRRDGAFTIFYMGINLGAFFAPLVCGFLRKKVHFHVGFAAAGVGMLIGLVVFLVGQKQVLADVAAAGNDLSIRKGPGGSGDGPKATGDEQLAGADGFSGVLSRVWPLLLLGIAVAAPSLLLFKAFSGQAPFVAVLMPTLYAGVAGWMGLTLLSIKGAARDKSTVIFILFMFTVLFWMAFEQAGNALNIWADVNTDLHVFGFEYTAEAFQSVNPLLIFTLAPAFAALWIWFAKRSIRVSTPAKMFAAMVFMAASFGAMVFGAISENTTVTSMPIAGLPQGLSPEKVGSFHAGRMSYDPASKTLSVRGVLPPFAVTEALRATVDPALLEDLEKLEKAGANATKKAPVTQKFGGASYPFPFDRKAQDESGTSWNAGQITITKPLDEKLKNALINAGGERTWRSSLEDLAKKSQAARVSGIWLLLSYFLATLGELCLSPVGLSMVTKLAPARFGSLFMGVWLLSSSVAQYVGGSIGENWGVWTPTYYFQVFVATSVVGSVLLFLLIKPIGRLMHDAE